VKIQIGDGGAIYQRGFELAASRENSSKPVGPNSIAGTAARSLPMRMTRDTESIGVKIACLSGAAFSRSC